MKLFVMLIALIALPVTLIAAPKYPFPNNVTYKYGIMPKGIDATKVQKAYEDFMKLYKEEGDLARIQWDTKEYTVSEGIGYGMMILVYMDNATNNTQAKFDKLWKYYNKFLDAKGLMDWKIKGFTGAEGLGDHNAATDAEMDVAMGLLQAYKQWNDEKYLTDAKSLIDKIRKSEVDSVNFLLNPGDSWGGQYNPSYFSTAALELFKQTGTYDWGKVLTNSYALLKKCQNANTGLVQDWCTKDGGVPGGRADKYSYDAARTPWRIGWAYSWYGHQDAKDVCTKIATWISTKTGNDASKVVDGYQRDGTETGEYNNATFVGPFACAGLVDAKHQAWLDNSYSTMNELAGSADVYYQQSLKVITLLLLSGNMPNLWDYPTGVTQLAQNAVSIKDGFAVDCSSLKTSGILFTTASSGNVTLSLYTASGKLVSIPVSGNITAGSHTVELSKRLAAGTYLVKMQMNGRSATKQMVVVR